MKKCLLILTMLMVALASHAAVVSPFGAQVRLQRLFTLTQARALTFGDVLVAATAGTVVLNATTGAISTTGGHISSGAQVVGEYTIANADPATAVMTVAVSNPTLTITGGGTATLAATLTTATPTVTMAAGTGVVRVGGTLTIPAAAAPGVYTGNFNLTVDYQ